MIFVVLKGILQLLCVVGPPGGVVTNNSVSPVNVWGSPATTGKRSVWNAVRHSFPSALVRATRKTGLWMVAFEPHHKAVVDGLGAGSAAAGTR